MGDKLSRLEVLVQPGRQAAVSDESLDDTCIDLANYALLLIILRRSEMIAQDSHALDLRGSKFTPNNNGTVREVEDALEKLWAESLSTPSKILISDIDAFTDACCIAGYVYRKIDDKAKVTAYRSKWSDSVIPVEVTK